MNIASKILKSQKSRYVTLAMRGLVIMVLGSFIGYKLLTEGLGKQSDDARSKGAFFTKVMKKILGDRADADQIMAYCLAGVMFLAVIYCFFCFVKGIYNMKAQRTVLGKSILLQAKNNEEFADTLASVDTDLTQGAKTFGKVYIGREWILESEVMRLSKIQGVFWIDAGESDFVLCCVDDKQNIWASSFTYKDDREHAIHYLQSRFPEIVFGNKDAYVRFLKQQTEEKAS